MKGILICRSLILYLTDEASTRLDFAICRSHQKRGKDMFEMSNVTSKRSNIIGKADYCEKSQRDDHRDISDRDI